MRTRWKPVQLDYLALAEYENVEQILVCLTQRQVAILKALVHTASWTTRWTNLEINADELEAQIEQIQNQLNGSDCDMVTLDFREQPEDLCQVQYSKDGGSTWLPMFRKDTCQPREITAGDVTNIQININTVITNNFTWEGDIINVAPQWEYEDEYSDRALCWVISVYVDWLCDSAIAQIKSGNAERRLTNDWIYDAGEIMSIALVTKLAVLATAATSIVIPAVVIGAFIFAAVSTLDVFWDSLLDVSPEYYEDEEARQIVKCIMYQAQTGTTPQWPAWRDSLDDYAVLGPAARGIGKSLYYMNQNSDVYINYMIMLEDINSISDTLPECPCADRWSHTWDFENVGMDTWIITGLGGEYQQGIGVVATIADMGDGWSAKLIQYLNFVDPVPRCDEWTMHGTVVRGNFDPGSYLGYGMQQPPLDEETWNSGYVTTGSLLKTAAFDLTNLDYVRVSLALCDSTQGECIGTMIITSINLKGEGVDPFFGRETA